MESTKTCRQCSKEQELTLYKSRKRQHDKISYDPVCRLCQNLNDAERNLARGQRICEGECGRLLQPEAYPKNSNHCHDCKKARAAVKTTAESAASKRARAPPPPTVCAGPCKRDFSGEDVDRTKVFVCRVEGLNPVWRSQCRQCQNVSKTNGRTYTQNHRKRKLESDPTAYRQHNSEVLREWHAAHPEKHAEYNRSRRTNVNRRLRDIEMEAARRGVTFTDEEDLRRMMGAPCHYCCGVPGEGETINGLDRVHPKGAYSADNVVPSCQACNFMKLSLPVGFFIKSVRQIVAHRGAGRGVVTELPVGAWFGGTTALRDRIKDKSGSLSRSQALEITSGSCCLCGSCAAVGVDRINSNSNYCVSNCAPCCSTCNYFKKHHTEDMLLEQVRRIHAHTKFWTLDQTQMSRFHAVTGVGN